MIYIDIHIQSYSRILGYARSVSCRLVQLLQNYLKNILRVVLNRLLLKSRKPISIFPPASNLACSDLSEMRGKQLETNTYGTHSSSLFYPCWLTYILRISAFCSHVHCSSNPSLQPLYRSNHRIVGIVVPCYARTFPARREFEHTWSISPWDLPLAWFTVYRHIWSLEVTFAEWCSRAVPWQGQSLSSGHWSRS